ncbi:hypothetical protein SLS53_009278 [Cytospora paraplurivora]|uniref:Rhodopsin domain-containing protein n=1 Tax=Cytospora paraplurivora TaxID=2898453 RepID=A0AAN9TYZ8_9PEZI
MSPPPNVDRGTLLQAVTFPLIAVALIFIVLRLWARSYKRTLVHFTAVSNGTRHWQYLSLEEKEYQLKLVTIHQPIAFMVTGLGRVAVGVTILRIFENTSRWEKQAVWAMLILMSTTTTIAVFVILFRCGPPQAQWDFAMMATAKCLPWNSYVRFDWFVIVVQTFADYFFSILPMAVVWRLKMSLRRRLTIMILLGLTLITAAAATVKSVIQLNVVPSDFTWNMVPACICNAIEAMFIIMFGSVPVLPPLWEACTHIRLPSVRSKLGTWMPKNPSASPNDCPLSTEAPSETAVQQARWFQDRDLELARLTDYPAPYISSAATAGVGTPSQSEEWESSGDRWEIHVHQVHQTITANSECEAGHITRTN